MTVDDFQPKYMTLRVEGEVIVVCLKHAQLSDEDNIDVMGRELFMLEDHFGCRKILLDLDRVEWVTSAVIGKLIRLHRRLHRKKGQLVLCHVRGGLRETLGACRLMDYFSIAETLDEARTML